MLKSIPFPGLLLVLAMATAGVSAVGNVGLPTLQLTEVGIVDGMQLAGALMKGE